MSLDVYSFCCPAAKREKLDADASWTGTSSDDYSQSESESELSFQGNTTASAFDSADEWSPSDSSLSDAEVEVDHYSNEYELASESSENELLPTESEEDTLSDSNVMLPVALVVAVSDEGESSLSADTDVVEELLVRSSPTSLGRSKNQDHWKCVQCAVYNEWPWRYCARCYKLRKHWLPERPKRKKKSVAKRSKDVKSDEKLLLEDVKKSIHTKTDEEMEGEHKWNSFPKETNGEFYSQHGSSSGYSSLETVISEDPAAYQDTNLAGSSQESNDSDRCQRCQQEPADGVFLHGRTAHQIYCFACCKEKWKNDKRCPACLRTVQKVIKVFHSFS